MSDTKSKDYLGTMVEAPAIKRVFCGNKHSLAVDENGGLWYAPQTRLKVNFTKNQLSSEVNFSPLVQTQCRILLITLDSLLDIPTEPPSQVNSTWVPRA